MVVQNLCHGFVISFVRYYKEHDAVRSCFFADGNIISLSVDILTTPFFDRPSFSPYVIVLFENLDTDR